MIQENRESRAAPRQSNTFKMLQEVLEADERGLQQYRSLFLYKNLDFVSYKISQI